MKNTKTSKKEKPRGKITVKSIPEDLLEKLPDNTSSMTAEEIHNFASAVFKRCIKCKGDPVDVSKLAKDYNEDELNYDPDTVVKGD